MGGVGLDIPPAAARAWLAEGGVVEENIGDEATGAVDLTEGEFAGSMAASTRGGLDWVACLARMPSRAAGLVFLDALAVHRFLIMQFVDDNFTTHSSAAGLRLANVALSTFCRQWRHCFQGGRKRPAVMAVGCSPPSAADCGEVCGVEPQIVDSIDILGAVVDRGLTLMPLLDRVCAQTLSKSHELAATLTDYGFGLPFQAAQFESRVEGSALHAAELLASCSIGWRQAASRLNDVQYKAAKDLLGIPGVSLGEGGHVKIFAETRFLTRMGARLVIRIVAARARLLCLPPDNPVGRVVVRR